LSTSDSAATTTAAQRIVVNSNHDEAISAVVEGEDKCTTCVSWVHHCSIGAIHGLITTTTPWLVTVEYGWKNTILLGALFAGAATLVPILGTLISPRFSVYVMTYAALATGLPYRWSFVVGFVLLPSCMSKAVSTTLSLSSSSTLTVVDPAPFVAYWLAASAAPLLYVLAMPHAPVVAACGIAFVASVAEFVARHRRKNREERTDASPSLMMTDLQTLQKTLF
jgi:hypothetical protein